jgi:hypothetical protein
MSQRRYEPMQVANVDDGRDNAANIYRVWKYMLIEINILLILSSFYIDFASTKTNNWNYSRQVGMRARVVSCSDGTIDEWKVHSDDGNSTIILPVLFDGDTNCLTSPYNSIPIATLMTLDTGNSIETFTSYFNPVERDYFPHIYHLVVLCGISLLFLLHMTYIEIIRRNDKYFDGWVILFATFKFFFAIFIVYKSLPFVQIESCIQTYNKTNAEQYCNKLSSLDIVIVSTIFPNDSLVLLWPLYVIGLPFFELYVLMSESCRRPQNTHLIQ